LIRLTESNYYPSVNEILRLANLKTNLHFLGLNSSAEIILLCHLIKLKKKELLSLIYGAIVKGNNPELRIYSLAKLATKFCPLCLKELAYFPQVWDSNFIFACPFHQCLLVTRCLGCHQEIKGLRNKLSQCHCGFDFRDSYCQPASSYEVNLARYLFSLEGDNFCRDSLREIYGNYNPIFEFNLSQFSWLVNFLKLHLYSYFARSRIFFDDDVPELIKLSYTLSWHTFVFYLFSSWRKNFTELFQWFEQQLLLHSYPFIALEELTKVLSSLAYYLPSKLTFARYINKYLLDLLYRYHIQQIEVIPVFLTQITYHDWLKNEAQLKLVDLDDLQTIRGFSLAWNVSENWDIKVGRLSNLRKFLVLLETEFQISHLTLASLFHSSISLFYYLPAPQSNLSGIVACYCPWILKLNDPFFSNILKPIYSPIF
jgi:hypothetical protein